MEKKELILSHMHDFGIKVISLHGHLSENGGY